MKLIASGLTLLLALGCATTQSIQVEDRSRTFEANYDAVFAASTRVLVADGYALNNIDKATGLINTDYKHRSGLTLKGQQRRKVNALLSEEGSATRVTFTFAVEQPNDSGDWQSVPFSTKAAMKYYNELFAKLEYELGDRAGSNP